MTQTELSKKPGEQMKKNEKLKKAIKDAGYSYETFAREIDVSKQTIQNVVNGQDIHKHTKQIICIKLNKTLTEIFGD